MATNRVVKVGGSLFDVPDFGRRLRAWLDVQPTRRTVLVCGGGAAADLVRQADAIDAIGEERSHWLALRALSLTAHLLAARLPGALVIEELGDRHYAWQCGQTPVLDMHAFAINDETVPDHLPHLWSVTSDSLAARVALFTGIPELVLLKSCALPVGGDWAEAARSGIVDAAFPEMVAKAGSRLRVEVVNFRHWQAADANAIAPQDPAP